MEDNIDDKKQGQQIGEDQGQKIEEHKDEVKKEFKSFFQSLKDFLTELLDIKKDTDKESTAQNIREGIFMRGHTAWILIFSILVASIGLNISSSAVVIGAMLISPLMGPILGVGFSIGINDIDTLRLSMINLGVMVALSLITSFIFFSIPIFNEATPEILARTKPDVRDVLIAISGGLALIIAISHPREQFNTVAGVAIATALMPPLCTAGFGLATGRLDYFGGAMFLFTINTIFIALTAFVTVKYLKFPMVKYINQAKRKRISSAASIVAIVIFSFSIYLFYGLFIETKFKTQAGKFINNLKSEGVNIIGDNKQIIDFETKEIKLYVFGNDYSKKEKNRWKNEMEELGLIDTKLTILQSQDDSKVRDDIDNLKNMYINSHKMITVKDETIRDKDVRINELEKDLRRYYNQEIQFGQISKEIKINYEHLKKIGFAREYITNFEKIDTLAVLTLQWNSKIRKKEIELQEGKMKKWLETRLNIKKIEIRSRK
ncbi:MAG: DUF389 domain-containing protein [Flavobacteriaceae bacterium]|nr:DUF389 domain-containing protein [Flavobacteriaceae bacterium]